MRVLFIGGTGIISTACSTLAAERGIDLTLLNRGRRTALPIGVKNLTADIDDPTDATRALHGKSFDVVVDWIAYTPSHIERDLNLFRGKTSQYVFISSASAYQKPSTHYLITESTPLANPHWEYSRNKIACEERLMHAYRTRGFPITVVRPSHTYDTVVPTSVGHWDYTVIDRMRRGKPVIVHGDGTSLWTLTHAEDFARAFVPLLANPQTIGHAFHIT